MIGIKYLTVVSSLYLLDNQILLKKLQNGVKNNCKKKNNISKKCLPLHRFNKQMIVLQI